MSNIGWQFRFTIGCVHIQWSNISPYLTIFINQLRHETLILRMCHFDWSKFIKRVDQSEESFFFQTQVPSPNHGQELSNVTSFMEPDFFSHWKAFDLFSLTLISIEWLLLTHREIFLRGGLIQGHTNNFLLRTQNSFNIKASPINYIAKGEELLFDLSSSAHLKIIFITWLEYRN